MRLSLPMQSMFNKENMSKEAITLPLSVVQEIVAKLGEMPAKFSFDLLKKIESLVKVDPETPAGASEK